MITEKNFEENRDSILYTLKKLGYVYAYRKDMKENYGLSIVKEGDGKYFYFDIGLVKNTEYKMPKYQLGIKADGKLIVLMAWKWSRYGSKLECHVCYTRDRFKTLCVEPTI